MSGGDRRPVGSLGGVAGLSSVRAGALGGLRRAGPVRVGYGCDVGRAAWITVWPEGNSQGTDVDERQRARLRRLVAELTDGGRELAGMPGHRTGLVERLREQGRHEEAALIKNGTGFSPYAGDNGVVWIILRPSTDSGSLRSGRRREQLFDHVNPWQWCCTFVTARVQRCRPQPECASGVN